MAGSFDEAKHPRAADGKFGEGAGSGKKSSAGKKAGAGKAAAIAKAWGHLSHDEFAQAKPILDKHGIKLDPVVHSWILENAAKAGFHLATEGGAFAKAANQIANDAAPKKPTPKQIAASAAKAKATKARIAAAKAKAKTAAADIVAKAKAKVAALKSKTASVVEKKTAALKAGRVKDPKAARAAIAKAKSDAKAKATAIVATAKAKAKERLAKAGVLPTGAKTAAQPMTDEHLAEARKNLLAKSTFEEEFAALTYSGHSYEQINKTLRSGKFHEGVVGDLDQNQLNITMGHLDTLMKKAKTDKPIVTYRGSDPHPSFMDLKPGQVFVDKAFVSTTIGNIPKEFRGGVMFHITSPKGTKIAGIPSKIPDEREMLLGRGSAFRLDKREESTYPDGRPMVVLHVTVVGQE